MKQTTKRWAHVRNCSNIVAKRQALRRREAYDIAEYPDPRVQGIEAGLAYLYFTQQSAYTKHNCRFTAHRITVLSPLSYISPSQGQARRAAAGEGCDCRCVRAAEELGRGVARAALAVCRCHPPWLFSWHSTTEQLQNRIERGGGSRDVGECLRWVEKFGLA